MGYIYVLICENNKFYIGKTNKYVDERFQEHITNPCAWTKKYKPLKIIHYFESNYDFDEDITTLEYMKKYGIENVRGGTYSQIFLPQHQYLTLQNQLIHVNDKCFTCHQEGHYANNCTNQFQIASLPQRFVSKPTISLATSNENDYVSFIVNQINSDLKSNEFIIKKIFENIQKLSYNVCFLTNKGNIYYMDYNKHKNIYGNLKKQNYSKEFNKNLINLIIATNFKSNHYCKIPKELDDLYELNQKLEILKQF